MMHQVDPSFQTRIDEFNAARPGPAEIAVAWNPKAVKTIQKVEFNLPVYDYDGRWVVYAIPVADSTHPLARHHLTQKLCSRLPDDSGREGVMLFSWCKRDALGHDAGYEPLDQRLFDALDMADSFKSRRHYEEMVEEPEQRKAIESSKRYRDIAGAVGEYWRGLDSLIISMNPQTKVSGDWRSSQLLHR